MCFKIAARLLRILMDLIFEHIQIRKFGFGTEEAVEFQLKGQAVEITLKIQDPGLYRNVMTVYCGTGAHIGNSGIGVAADDSTAGINTEFGYRDSCRNPKICRGNTKGSSNLPTVKNLTGKDMGMTQIPDGRFHFTSFDQTADQRGGDPLAVQQLLRYDDTGKLSDAAESGELFRVALAPVTEMEIIPADKTGSALLQQIFQKTFPWG